MDELFHRNFVGFLEPDKDMSVLYNDNGSVRATLIHETSYRDDIPALYTMREMPHRGLPSAYLIYMFSDTEYEAAMKLFGSWMIWNKYCNSDHFLNGNGAETTWSGVAQWRQEKERQDEARAYSQLREAADMGSIPAMKTLWDSHNKPKRGRPSKDEISEAAREAAADAQRIKDDLKMIRLATVDGKERKQKTGS